MSIKSCLDCPSLLDAQEAAAFFGHDSNKSMPMCSRFGHVYGSQGSNSVNVDAATKLASGCSSFGQPKADKAPADISASWFTPRPELLEASKHVLPDCRSCVNFDDAMSACAASGRVIFSNRIKQEANGCAWAKELTFGTRREQVGAVLTGFGTATQVFVRASSMGATSKPATKRATRKAVKLFDPTTHASDAPVSEDHKKRGIRAWLKHETRRGKTYYLPIFDPSSFGEDSEFVPSALSEHGDPSLYIDHAGLLDEFAVSVYNKDLNLVLVGEPGTGKTEGVRWLAYTMQMPFMRLSYSELSEPEQFLGQQQFDPVKGTYFEEGLLPEWWQKVGFLLSDEPNLAPEAIMQSYRSMNDSSRTLTVYRKQYQRNDYCFHVMAINPHWDFRNIGAKPLASADSRRLTFMWMPNPDEAQLRAIINTAVEKIDGEAPRKELLDVIMKIGKDLRAMSKEGTLPDFWTVSQEIKVVRLVEDFGIEGAYRRAYFNYIAPEDAEPAMAAIKTHVPYGSEWA